MKKIQLSENQIRILKDIMDCYPCPIKIGYSNGILHQSAESLKKKGLVSINFIFSRSVDSNVVSCSGGRFAELTDLGKKISKSL